MQYRDFYALLRHTSVENVLCKLWGLKGFSKHEAFRAAGKPCNAAQGSERI